MLQETIFTALQAFFPDAPLVPVVTTSEEPPADEKKAKKPEKSSPRPNGVLKREYAVHGYHVDAQVSPEQLHAAVQLLDQHQFFLETITGVDWLAEQQMEAIYDFSNYSLEPCRVVIRTRIPRDNPELPSITEIYPGANWHERETHDFFGIVFTGHPHLIPLLLPEDADFHPLRKDYTA